MEEVKKMKNQNRMSRELESREAESREESWVPPNQLPTPEPQDGYRFRWVRTSVMGLEDQEMYRSVVVKAGSPLKLKIILNFFWN